MGLAHGIDTALLLLIGLWPPGALGNAINGTDQSLSRIPEAAGASEVTEILPKSLGVSRDSGQLLARLGVGRGVVVPGVREIANG